MICPGLRHIKQVTTNLGHRRILPEVIIRARRRWNRTGDQDRSLVIHRFPGFQRKEDRVYRVLGQRDEDDPLLIPTSAWTLHKEGDLDPMQNAQRWMSALEIDQHRILQSSDQCHFPPILHILPPVVAIGMTK